MDLEHLLRDLPKYKPWLADHSWREWEEFIAKRDDLLLTQPHLHTNQWNIQKLISAAILRPSPAPVTPLSRETAILLAKETSAPPKVHV